MKNQNKYITRIGVFFVGLLFMALGVALSVKADLGVSPISCLPYVLSLKFVPSIGTFTIIMNVCLMILQMLLLRRKYKLVQLVQFPVVFIFGICIDFFLNLLSEVTISNYWLQATVCLLSCVVLAFGLFLVVQTKLTSLPGDGVAIAIHQTFNVDFSKAKIGIDSCMVCLGIISSFIFFTQLRGIREGTVVAAFLVGVLVKFYTKVFTFYRIDNFSKN